MIYPFLGFIPPNPLIPVPRWRFKSRVSAWSFWWCATAIALQSRFWRKCSNHSYRSSRAAISIEIPFVLAWSIVAKSVICRGMRHFAHNSSTKCWSRIDSSPLKWKLQWAASHAYPHARNKYRRATESAPPLTPTNTLSESSRSRCEWIYCLNRCSI